MFGCYYIVFHELRTLEPNHAYPKGNTQSMNELKPDDASLVALIAQSQTDALNKLYDRYNRLVFSVSLAIVGDRAIA